jgi:hypothetical protein
MFWLCNGPMDSNVEVRTLWSSLVNECRYECHLILLALSCLCHELLSVLVNSIGIGRCLRKIHEPGVSQLLQNIFTLQFIK